MIKEKFNLDNKVAVITGASKGIGESIARGLAEFGANVVISSRKQEAVDKVASKFNSEGLSAIGIESNIENIGLEDVGIVTENNKIIVDDYYQTNIPGYFAIGDVLKTQALAHVASAEGIICVEKIAGHEVEKIDYNNIPGCTYCSPEIASVGMTEEQAKKAGYELKIGKFPFTASGKAAAAGHKDGFVKVIFDSKYGEWLGCHMIGHNVTEMISEAVVARKLETTGKEILKAIHPHPTMSEAIMEAVADAYDEVIHI